MKDIVFTKIDNNKEQYMDLLLEADPSKVLVNKYLEYGDLYILENNGEVVCVAVVTKVDDFVCELKNIATVEKFRGQGFGKKMIQYLFKIYKLQFKKMIVGTTENNIPFYVKQGFDNYYKTVKNFFVDNYSEEIWDGDLHCIDMYYYSKDLRKE